MTKVIIFDYLKPTVNNVMDPAILVGVVVLFLVLISLYPILPYYKRQVVEEASDLEQKTTNNVLQLISDTQQSIWYFSKQYNDFNSQLLVTIAPHLPTLVRKHKQLVTTDDYGIIQTDRWRKEIEYFLSNVIVSDIEWFCDELERIGDLQVALMSKFQTLKGCIGNASTKAYELANVTFDAIQKDYNEAMQLAPNSEWSLSNQLEFLITGIVCTSDEYLKRAIGLVESCSSGSEYETLCASILSDLGWDVAHRGGSGDQGVDLVGTLYGQRVVFQCKLYSSPVGNAAVQEVIAGKTFESADLGVVISNNTFTASAKQLAQVAGVVLLGHDQLNELTESIAERFEVTHSDTI